MKQSVHPVQNANRLYKIDTLLLTCINIVDIDCATHCIYELFIFLFSILLHVLGHLYAMCFYEPLTENRCFVFLHLHCVGKQYFMDRIERLTSKQLVLCVKLILPLNLIRKIFKLIFSKEILCCNMRRKILIYS
jgi:hypothetical protein